MCQPEAAKNPPDRATVDVDTMRLRQFPGQFGERDLPLGSDAGLDPVGHTKQLAVPATIALLTRRQRVGFAPQLHQFVHELRGHT